MVDGMTAVISLSVEYPGISIPEQNAVRQSVLQAGQACASDTAAFPEVGADAKIKKPLP